MVIWKLVNPLKSEAFWSFLNSFDIAFLNPLSCVLLCDHHRTWMDGLCCFRSSSKLALLYCYMISLKLSTSFRVLWLFLNYSWPSLISRYYWALLNMIVFEEFCPRLWSFWKLREIHFVFCSRLWSLNAFWSGSTSVIIFDGVAFLKLSNSVINCVLNFAIIIEVIELWGFILSTAINVVAMIVIVFNSTCYDLF